MGELWHKVRELQTLAHGEGASVDVPKSLRRLEETGCVKLFEHEVAWTRCTETPGSPLGELTRSIAV